MTVLCATQRVQQRYASNKMTVELLHHRSEMIKHFWLPDVRF